MKKYFECPYCKSVECTMERPCNDCIHNKAEQIQQYKEGEWLYSNKYGECIVRFKSTHKEGFCSPFDVLVYSEKYEITELGTVFDKRDGDIANQNWFNSFTKATPSQIERILTKVAEYKGFKAGIRIDNTNIIGHTSIRAIDNYRLCYDIKSDSLSMDCKFIYEKGKWATIIKEKTEVEKFLEWIDKEYKHNLNSIYQEYINRPKSF